MKNRNSRSAAKRFKGRGAFTKKGIKKDGYVRYYDIGDNLSKEMPGIPMLDKFPEYVRIGKELAGLHLAYEQEGDPASIGLEIRIDKPDYTVEKMQFKKEGKAVQKDTIYFNRYITISNIPKRTYGKKIIMTNGFIKKTQETPKQEIRLAKLYRKDYLERVKENE